MSATPSGSITLLLKQFRAGDEAVFTQLFQRLRPAILDLARQRLQGAACRDADEEDMAQQAFLDLYLGLKQGRFPELHNRQHLCALLGHVTLCETINRLARARSQKNGGGQVRCEADLTPAGAEVEACLLDLQAQGREPTPLEHACLRDCYQHYMNHLDEDLRPVAELHLGGATAEQIAAQIGRSARTVERYLALIRAKWRWLAARDEGPP